MARYQTLPYDILSENDWTVSFLFRAKHFEESWGVKLTDIATINKQKINSLTINQEETYNYIEVSSISNELGEECKPIHVLGKEMKARTKWIAHKGDIVVSLVRPERGAIAIITSELDGCLVANSIAVLTPKNVLPELLFFLLKHSIVLDDFKSLAKGIHIPTMSLKDLKNYRFPIKQIPLSESENARNIYREFLNSNRNSTFEDIATKVFKETIIQSISEPSKDQINMYCVLPYSEMKERLDVQYYFAKLREPKINWNCLDKELAKVAKFKTKVSTSYKESDSDKGIPYIRILNISEDRLYVQNYDLAFTQIESSQQARVKKGDIVFAKVGATLGKSAVVPECLEGGVTTQHLLTIECSNEIIPEYLVCFLKTCWVKRFLAMNRAGSSQPFIHISVVKTLKIPIPNVRVQEEIIDKIKQEYANTISDNNQLVIQQFIDHLIPETIK